MVWLKRRQILVAMVTTAAIVSGASPAVHAQSSGSRRIAFDTVVGVQDIFRETRDSPTMVVIDPLMGAEIRRRLQVTVRPKIYRLNREWDLMLDQASVDYSFHAGSNWRIEAGKFPSTVGLGMTENRSNVNPGVFWWHRPYYMPLPRLGAGAPMVSLVSATYPSGVAVASSATHWDVRAALVDTAPVQFWRGNTGADRKLNRVLGAGLTPRQGLRFGVSTAGGDLTDAPAGNYRLINVEGDYSVGYTRISGEATHDTFDMPDGDYAVWGWTLQAQHTVTPRLFVHARATEIQAPGLAGAPPAGVRPFRALDSTVGYRIDPELTLRVGYSAVRTWGATAVDHQAGLSLMWSRRWW